MKFNCEGHMKEINLILKVKINSTIPKKELIETLKDQVEKLKDYFFGDCRTESCDISVEISKELN